MILKKNIIFNTFGIKITHDKFDSPNGCMFIFEDINPHVSFRSVLSKKDRIYIAYFFLRSVFVTKKLKNNPPVFTGPFNTSDRVPHDTK